MLFSLLSPRRAFTAAAGLAAAAVLGAASLPQHGSLTNWQVVVIEGTSQLDPVTNTFNGSGTIVVDGVGSPLSWQSVVLGTLSAEPDGTLHLIGSHTFLSDTQTRRFEFTTFDEVTAVPTGQPGVFTLTSHLTIQEGSGAFGQGQILATGGTLDFGNGSVVIPGAIGRLARDR